MILFASKMTTLVPDHSSIQLSQAAVNELLRLSTKYERSNSAPSQSTRLRLGIQSGGCAGLFYTMDFNSVVEPDDRLYTSKGISVVVDPTSHIHLKGLVLDYSEDMMGGSFRFHNPQATQHCDCGNSFSIG